MEALLLKILGVDAEGGAGIDSISFNFLNSAAFPYMLVLAVILAGLTLFLYIRELETVSKRLRLILASVRVIILLFLMMVFLEPVLVIEQSSENKPYAVVLVDRSISMSIKDEQGLRMEIANNILNERSAAMLRKLTNKYQLKVYAFSNETGEVDLLKARKGDNLRIDTDKNGYSTGIGVAVNKALSDLAGQPVAGIIILTDGGSNTGDDALEAAKIAGEKGIPLYPIGIGDPRVKKDVMVTNVFSEETAVKGDVINMSSTIEARGYKSLTIPVRVMLKDKVLKETNVTLGVDGKAEVNLNFIAEEVGERDYEILLPGQPGEVSEVNNKRIARIKVTDDKLKVLYVDGYPRWLYRYLVRSLKRDKGLSISGLLETVNPADFSEGDLPIKGFPRIKEQLYDYDVLIIGDVSRNYFSQGQIDLIKSFVTEKGGGLFLLPGERWASANGRIPELEKLMPVELENGAFNPVAPFKIELAEEGKSSQVFLLEENTKDNLKAWSSLEGVYYTLRSAKEKPGALIYAKYRNVKAGTNVFAASQRAGNGKVMVFTSDDVWRWRFKNENKYFYRVFGQAIRWLGPDKAAAEDKFIKLTADKKKYLAGEKVFVTARITGKGYSGLKEAEAPGYFSGANRVKEPFTLVRLARDSTLYTGEFTPTFGGEYSIWLEHPSLPPEARNVKEKISVEIPNMEYEAPELNEELLKKMAEASEGEYFGWNMSSNVADKVIKTKPRVTIRTEKGLKDSPFVILFFTLLVGIEWFIRRNKNLM